MPSKMTEFALKTFLPYRLAVLATTVSRSLGEVYGHKFGLSIAEWRVLANLGHAGPMYAGELAERSSMDKPKVTRALQRLEAVGYIVRKIDVEDRRQARLFLTKKGETIYADVAKLALAWEDELMSPLDKTERKAFEKCLEKLAQKASTMRSAAKGTGCEMPPKGVKS